MTPAPPLEELPPLLDELLVLPLLDELLVLEELLLEELLLDEELLLAPPEPPSPPVPSVSPDEPPHETRTIAKRPLAAIRRIDIESLLCAPPSAPMLV